MDWKTLLDEGTAYLDDAGILDAEQDAWYLLEFVTGMDRAAFFLHRWEESDETLVERYRDFIQKRMQHIPLQHLTGMQEFMGYFFLVNGDVLIPRQDTELLVEKVLPLLPGRKALDLCTGSGCIAVSLALMEKTASVDASDVSEGALSVARQNAKRNGANVHFVKSDLLEQISDSYDVIVSNPPYVASAVVDTLMPEVREFEPRIALDGGEDGLDFYRRIVRQAREHLRPGGMLWLEIGYDQGDSVPELLEREGYYEISLFRDYGGRNRVVCGTLRCRKEK